ncbi:MAG TPA: hypothetical protein VFN14_02560 [Candidatus Limnocylindria bacterium]|nr:hypothetical protein [Candidatus Limnocylindria bacterium]
MSASKRPSTSSLRRFITTRPYVTVAELRRRFLLDDPDAVCCVRRNGTHAFVGLPEREAAKLQDLWERDEIGLELSVEVHAPVVVGVYPMHIARFIQDGNANGYANGHANGHAHGRANRQADAVADGAATNGFVPRQAPPPTAG